jgi:Mycothiol-dependent nitroreductase Rv2466c
VSITFWFDPSCPFTWRTSRWIREVAARRGETVQWRFLSLAILNEGKDIPEHYRKSHVWSRGALRVLAAADERHGQETVDRLYTAIGSRIHNQGAGRTAEVLAEAVAAADLPPELTQAISEVSLDKLVRESHDAAQARVGTETGSPVTAVDDGPGFFGPIIVPVPEANDADRLFEALCLLSSIPQFSELKRVRNPL